MKTGTLNSVEVISLVIGLLSLIVTVIFIQDKALRISIAVVVFLVIISAFFSAIFNELNYQASELQKINERIDIYQRLNKLETVLQFRGERK